MDLLKKDVGSKVLTAGPVMTSIRTLRDSHEPILGL